MNAQRWLETRRCPEGEEAGVLLSALFTIGRRQPAEKISGAFFESGSRRPGGDLLSAPPIAPLVASELLPAAQDVNANQIRFRTAWLTGREKSR